MKVETLTEQMLFSTVLIRTQTPAGSMSGTGFIFGYRHKDQDYLVIATNKHVYQNAVSGQLLFTLSDGTQPLIGQRQVLNIDDFQAMWHGHPNPAIDVAVAPFFPLLRHLEEANVKVFFRAIPHTLIPDRNFLEDLDPLEEILFVGYPNGLYDTANLLPIMRKGTTATPIQIDYCGNPTFLIDASVFGGSSGSPVFLYNRGGYADRKGNTYLGSRIQFLGILAAVHFSEDLNSTVPVTT